jgi:hypothetical protein
MLWKILKILGVPDYLIEVLKKLYTDVTINLRVGEKLEQFLSTSGVKQGDNLAPVLFIFVIHAVSNSIDKKWEFEILTYDGIRILKLGNREVSYVQPTLILLSRGELVTASKLIVSYFRRFGLTIRTCVLRANRSFENGGYSRPGQESPAAGTKDIEIDDDGFMSFCIKFKYLGTCLCLNSVTW